MRFILPVVTIWVLFFIHAVGRDSGRDFRLHRGFRTPNAHHNELMRCPRTRTIEEEKSFRLCSSFIYVMFLFCWNVSIGGIRGISFTWMRVRGSCDFTLCSVRRRNIKLKSELGKNDTHTWPRNWLGIDFRCLDLIAFALWFLSHFFFQLRPIACGQSFVGFV